MVASDRRRSSLSTANLDYWQRVGMVPDHFLPSSSTTGSPPEGRRLLRIVCVGRRSGGLRDGDEERIPEGQRRATEVLTGLFTAGISVAFVVRGGGDEVHVDWGHWSAESVHEGILNEREELLRALLAGAYPALDISAASVEFKPLPHAAVAIGIPSPGVRGLHDEGPLDRLLRAMRGAGEWRVHVLAQPVDPSAITATRHSVVNEIRSVETEGQAGGTPSPLAEHFSKLLTRALEEMADAEAVGAWRTAIYLTAERDAYFRLITAWSAAYIGDDYPSVPLRLFDVTAASRFAADWSMPDAEAPPGPGEFRHPFALQTMLSSRQLATLVRAPERETPGFQIVRSPHFDVVASPPDPSSSTIEIGRVCDENGPIDATFRTTLKSLARHVLVAGTTGSGKTNTVFHLLQQAARRDIPFLVIEPTKTEYRELLAGELGRDLTVFTLGDETLSPFRLNPFEAPPGVSIQGHLDRLKATFLASFVLYAPMPHILERCLYEVYADRGWDLVSGRCRRGSHPHSFPTLRDLDHKVKEVVESLGYDIRLTSDLRAALETRVRSLRVGGKGLMLDTPISIPIQSLLERPTILELDALGDDDEKAFVIGLLLTAMYEYRRVEGASRDGRLRHLTIVEEAHRLLRRRAEVSDPEGANLAAKAVESFTHMLAEVRAYGEGIVVSEQIPTKLSPDVLKNTNLKITHRLVDEEERRVVGGTMVLDPHQTDWLASCPVGRAVVFGAGDDGGVLVQVPRVELPEKTGAQISEMLRARSSQLAGEFADVFDPYAWALLKPGTIAGDHVAARRAVESEEIQEAFRTWVVACAFSEHGVLGGRNVVLAALRRFGRGSRAVQLRSYECLAGIDAAIERLASEHGVPYDDADRIKQRFVALLDETGAQLSNEGRETWKDLQTDIRTTFACPDPPFSACATICPDSTCMFRSTAETNVRRDGLAESVVTALRVSKPEEFWAEFESILRRSAEAGTLAAAGVEASYRGTMCTALHALESVRGLDDGRRKSLLSGIHRILVRQEDSWGATSSA